jgi:hypothetical protein
MSVGALDSALTEHAAHDIVYSNLFTGTAILVPISELSSDIRHIFNTEEY